MHSYAFANLLGATYKGGTVVFSPDGNTLLSPVGNRVNTVDLVQGRTHTLVPEAKHDIAVLALAPDCRLLLVIDTKGHALLINYIRGNVLGRMNFKGHVQSARWSPDSQYFCVTVERKAQVWRAPSIRLGWQFVQQSVLTGHIDDVVDLDWSPDSLFLATSSKDFSVRLHSVKPMEGFERMCLAEHRSAVRGAFFSADMKHLFSLSREGVFVCLKHENEEDAEDDVKDRHPYCRPGRWSIGGKAVVQKDRNQKVMRCDFCRASRIFAAAFSQGIFMLFEMPDMTALQTLSLGRDSLDAIQLGAKGDWVAIGSSKLGQLFVWEWRSETYVLKQQGHHWGVNCVAFSPAGGNIRNDKSLAKNEARAEDRSSALGGRLMATGGYDGKVKLFNAQSGLCFVTFAEHTAPVTALCFTPQGNAILSASQDGSVRAFDLLRYRNFRTFASPDGLCQFAGVAVDGGGEIVAASSTGGSYSIYVWSIQTGNVLEVLTSHTSYVYCLRFSPSPANPGQLISASWDSTLKVWDLYKNAAKGGSAETLDCPSAVVSVAYDPRGNDEVACSCLSGQVMFWNVSTSQTLGSIDGLRDIQSARQWHEEFGSVTRGKKPGQGLQQKATTFTNQNQHFNSIAYARSGELLLCGSRNSPHVCLYETSAYGLVIRLSLTKNASLSGVDVHINTKTMLENGSRLQELDLSDEEADDIEIAKKQARIKQAQTLPGVTVGETKSAYSEKELHIWNVAFSADMQQFAAATTHGVFIFSADMGLGVAGGSTASSSSFGRFVPQMLTKRVSAPAVLKALEAGDLSQAMILALALNDYGLLRKAYQSVPVESVPIVCASIGAPLLPALIWFLSLEMRPSTGTPHFQFHMAWVTSIIDLHYMTLLDMASGKATARTGAALEAAAASRSDVSALCLQLLVELSQRHSSMSKTFDSNTYLLRYLSSAPSANAAVQHQPALPDELKPKAPGKRRKEAAAAPPQTPAALPASEVGATEGGQPKKKKRKKALAA
eukprot:TRINITY_DN80552_c0_g1_i1.p1 TRINITY_DN80552_c0_g1~~TRINITY_DN80552_c0_g1_i1.p1  ORF type:complete len:1002 (+),score=244.88 TRINITY_DN80552_c0_g1_i1:151-3156(+)